MPEHEPLNYRLRCHTKRTDLPPDVLRDIGEAYEAIVRLTAERDEVRQEVCLWQGLDTGKTSEEVAKVRGWNCYKEEAPTPPVVKTLKGVIRDGGKAVPPKFEITEDDK